MVNAGVALRIHSNIFGIDVKHFHHATSKIECLFDRLRHARVHVRAHNDTVNHDFNRVFVALLQVRKFIECIHHAVHARTGKPKPGVLLGNMRKFTLFVFNNRRQEHQTLARVVSQNRIDNILWRAPLHSRAINRTMWHTNTRKQQTHIVIDFGHSRHG